MSLHGGWAELGVEEEEEDSREGKAGAERAGERGLPANRIRRERPWKGKGYSSGPTRTQQHQTQEKEAGSRKQESGNRKQETNGPKEGALA